MKIRTKNSLIIGVIMALCIYPGYVIVSGRLRSKTPNFQFVTLKRGNIENTVSSSGTISPVTTVQIGTQVSGIIAKVFVDFNYKVKDGQLLAVLDTSLLKSDLMNAQANLEINEAQLEEAQKNYDMNKKLFDKKVISASDFLPYEINLKTQKGNVKSARAALAKAEYNLKFAYIRSPINGTVTSRNVDAGQTVAASFSTPTLFEIAQNLENMEILAQVDESDIGTIREGQDARFQVEAYSDKTFYGKVLQIRLNPVTVSNVVNYTVVVTAENKDNYLLPGMTATVDFITEKADSVLVAPVKALHFQPTAEMMTEFRKNMEKRMSEIPDSVRKQYEMVRARFGNTNFSRNNPAVRNQNANRIWYLDDQGNLMMTRVQPGISDGKNIEIKSGRNLKEGMKIIVGFTSEANNTASRTTTMPRFGRGF